MRKQDGVVILTMEITKMANLLISVEVYLLVRSTTLLGLLLYATNIIGHCYKPLILLDNHL